MKKCYITVFVLVALFIGVCFVGNYMDNVHRRNLQEMTVKSACLVTLSSIVNGDDVILQEDIPNVEVDMEPLKDYAKQKGYIIKECILRDGSSTKTILVFIKVTK